MKYRTRSSLVCPASGNSTLRGFEIDTSRPATTTTSCSAAIARSLYHLAARRGRCRRRAVRAIFLGETIASVLHREAAITARGHLDVIAAVFLGEVGDEVVGRLHVHGDELRKVQLPEVLEAG